MVKWQRALYQPGVPLGENGTRVTASKEHRELSKEAAKEGMVLLKNEQNLLPLEKGSKVALFGKATFDYVKGGGGSGDVTVSYVKNLYEGFLELKDTVRITSIFCAISTERKPSFSIRSNLSFITASVFCTDT